MTNGLNNLKRNKMNKILIIITLLTILLSSCGRQPADFRKGVIIKDIESYDAGCVYFTENTVWYFMGWKLHTAYFYDSCGKYTVGDTLKLIKHGNNMY